MTMLQDSSTVERATTVAAGAGVSPSSAPRPIVWYVREGWQVRVLDDDNAAWDLVLTEYAFSTYRAAMTAAGYRAEEAADWAQGRGK